MIFPIFMILFIISIVFIISGYYIKNKLILIFGLLILGLLSLPLFSQSLEYKTGIQTSTDYIYNESALSNTLALETPIYETYTDTLWYGIFFIFSSLSGLFYLYSGYRKEKRRQNDEGEYND